MVTKKQLYITPILLMLVALVVASMAAVSCGSNPRIESQLSGVESLIVQHPDSAVAILAAMDTTAMSEKQIARQELLYLYINTIYGYPIPIDSAEIASGDMAFSDMIDNDGVKWLIVKSAQAKRTDNPVARIELLKDAEFLALQLNDNVDLGIIYLFLSNVYHRSFNGTLSKYYADKAIEIFSDLGWQNKIRESRMAVVGAYIVQRDYKSALDSLIAMQPEVMANAHDSFRLYFLDELARSYDSDGQSRKAIDIWHSIYDGEEVSANTLAHWADAYNHINELDSAYALIQYAKSLPHNTSDEALCLNVEYNILEKMGRIAELARIDSLRIVSNTNAVKERRLEESSLALNLKYDSTARNAWMEAAEARNRTNIAISVTTLAILVCTAAVIFLRKRNRMLRLEHENDLLRIRSIQDNLFESNRRNKDVADRISDLFQTRFRLLDSLAATYFECKDTGQEQKRVYSRVKNALSEISSNDATRELADIVNGYNDNLMDKFRAEFPKLPASQYRLALYLFCGFSLPSISIFTGSEIRNIYVYKSRLKSVISKSDSPLKAEYLKYFG